MNKIFFMHIPKCGGTSIKKGLSKSYGGKRVFSLDAHASKYVVDSFRGHDGLHAFRDKLILYAMATKKYDLIMGHSVFNSLMVSDFSEEFDLVTLVRDPVSRFLSHFFYNRFKESKHFKIDDDFKSFLDSESARALGRFYVKYFSGEGSPPNLDRAIGNLKYFKVIGRLENLDEFSRVMKKEFLVDLCFEHDNKNPVSEENKLLNVGGEELEKIQYLCADDIKIYQKIVDDC